MPQKRASFAKQATIILVIAGLVVLWDVLTPNPGRNGTWSVLAVALAALLLGAMYMGRVHEDRPDDNNIPPSTPPPPNETEEPTEPQIPIPEEKTRLLQ